MYIYIYIYIYIYGNHKTLISHRGCSYYLVITGQKEQTILCITFRHSPSSDAWHGTVYMASYLRKAIVKKSKLHNKFLKKKIEVSRRPYAKQRNH